MSYQKLAVVFLSCFLYSAVFSQWVDLNVTIQPNTFTSFFFINEQTGWASGYQPTGHNVNIIKTTNGGLNWQVQYTSNIYVKLPGLYFINAQTGWSVGISEIYPTNGFGNIMSPILETTN